MWYDRDAAELFILVLVKVTLAVAEGDRGVRQGKLLHQLSGNVVSGFGWNLVCCLDLLAR